MSLLNVSHRKKLNDTTPNGQYFKSLFCALVKYQTEVRSALNTSQELLLEEGDSDPEDLEYQLVQSKIKRLQEKYQDIKEENEAILALKQRRRNNLTKAPRNKKIINAKNKFLKHDLKLSKGIENVQSDISRLSEKNKKIIECLERQINKLNDIKEENSVVQNLSFSALDAASWSTIGDEKGDCWNWTTSNDMSNSTDAENTPQDTLEDNSNHNSNVDSAMPNVDTMKCAEELVEEEIADDEDFSDQCYPYFDNHRGWVYVTSTPKSASPTVEETEQKISVLKEVIDNAKEASLAEKPMLRKVDEQSEPLLRDTDTDSETDSEDDDDEEVMIEQLKMSCHLCKHFFSGAILVLLGVLIVMAILYLLRYTIGADLESLLKLPTFLFPY